MSLPRERGGTVVRDSYPEATAIERVIGEWAHQVPGYLVAHAAPLAAGVAGIVLLPRLLGPTGYGVYAVALASATAAAAWLGDWLVPAGLRLAPEAGPCARDLWVALGQLSLAAGVAAGVIAGALSAHFGRSTLLLASALAGLAVTSRPLAAHLRAGMHAGMLALWAAVTSVAALVLGVGLFLATHEAASVLGGAILAGLAGALVYVLRTRWVLGPHARARSWWRPVLRFGLPIAVTGIGGQFLLLGDRYLLATLKGPEAAGVYTAAYGVAEKMVGLPFGILFGAMYAVGARTWASGDRLASVDLLRTVVRILGALAGSVVVFQAATGVWLTRLVAGAPFEPTAMVPLLVSAGTWLWYLGILQHQALEWDKRTLLITVLTLGAAGLNLAMNLALIPARGSAGAAVATFGAYGAYLVAATLAVTRFVGVGRVWGWRPLLAAVACALAAHIVWDGQGGPLVGGVAIVGYLALLWAVRGWSPQESLALLRRGVNGAHL